MKVLVIGSGPIVIGQAAEFDYSGTQCIQVLKELGHQVIVFNSNPATIMTDTNTGNLGADKVYMEPMTCEYLKKVLIQENPDGILVSFGGQTALNLARELYQDGFLQKNHIKTLGSSIECIQRAEDRQLFRQAMKEINVPTPPSEIVSSLSAGITAAHSIGYPLIIRPAYTLGGSGGGIAHNEEELISILQQGLEMSSIHQCLVEKSIAGFKEIEYEVIRDINDNAIIVCNMENLDPVGVHTGDSIVFAPSQTLSDQDYHRLRQVSLEIIRHLGVIGACNVQLALDPASDQYYVIEVNPRVSRSSALASKATGFPIAKIATYTCLGHNLDEIKNPVTQNSYAAFEPALDYIVCKFPRFPFDKFPNAKRTLGSQMKATGEVMALGANVEESLLKAVRSLELNCDHLFIADLATKTQEELLSLLTLCRDDRLFVITELLRRGIKLSSLSEATKIDYFFLKKLQNIIDCENELKNHVHNISKLQKAKKLGFSDEMIARLWDTLPVSIREQRQDHNIRPVRKMVDTCAGEFPAATPYYYLTYSGECDDEPQGQGNCSQQGVLIIGSGPIRIGQGIEFDYSSVHALIACKEMNYQTIMVNNNPETCSTDFSMSDILYFEPLDDETILEIITRENPVGTLAQFGGQTGLKLAKTIDDNNYPLLGTSWPSIKIAEDRKRFEEVLNKLAIPRPMAFTVSSWDELTEIQENLPYPVVIRPSFVLGGKSMEIIFDSQDLINSAQQIQFTDKAPLLIDQYIHGVEIEVDAISDGENIFVPGFMEHLERAGVHSGDSIAIYPARFANTHIQEQMIAYISKLARELNIVGIMNFQFMYRKDELYIIEMNPRASRTLPFISKMTQVPMAQLATQLCVKPHKKLSDFSYGTDLYPPRDYFALKVPVFSFEKLPDVDTALGPEMKSTGEALGKDQNFSLALYKGILAQGVKIPLTGHILITISDRTKSESVDLVKKFQDIGFKIHATSGTANFLEQQGIQQVSQVAKIGEPTPNLLSLLSEGYFDIVINTISKGKQSNRDGFILRQKSAQKKIPCFTSLDTAYAFVHMLEYRHVGVNPCP